MARIIARFCVWTSFVVLSCGQPPLASAEIRFDHIRLSEIPEAEIVCQPGREHESLGQPPCRFLDRHLASTCRVNEGIDTSATSCPMEAKHGKQDRSANIWNKVSRRCSQLSEYFNSRTGQSARRLSKTVNQLAIKAICLGYSQVKNVVSEINLPSPFRLDETQPVSLPETNVDETTTPAELETDRYWQYYDDCDHWKVIFALASQRTYLEAACLSSTGSILIHGHPFTQLIQGLFTRNLLRTVGATNELICELREAISEQVRLQEFRNIESAGIGLTRKAKSLARSLQAGWESQLRAVTGVVSQIRMEQLISQKRSYPANALRSRSDHSFRYSSLR